ncbi:MAG: hypothetical protein ACK52I_12110 [Pseudomonadota bacterium]|jgi:hypothetical protein
MSTIVPPPSALNNIVPFKPVAPIPPITAPTPIGAVIAAGAITAALVTAAAIAYSDMRSAEESAKRAKENTEKALARLNTGKQDLFAPPPFQGGQCQGVQYVVSGRDIVTNETGYNWTVTVPGRISAPSTLIASGGFVSHGFYYGNQTANNFYSRGGANWYGVGKDVVGITITSVTPQGGLADNCGSLSTPKLGETTPNQNGLGTGSSKSNNLLAPSPTSSTSARPDTSTQPSINNSTTANTFNSTTNKNKNLATGNITNSLNIGRAIGLGSPAIAPNPSPIKTPTPISTPPSTKPKKEEERKPFLPPIPSELGKINADIVSLNSQIAGIGAILGTISANTAPEAQRLNSKNGTCDAMQSPSCTQGMEGRIKDPINAKLDAAQVARDVNASAQSAALSVLASFVSRIYNNQFVHSSLSFMTTMTTIHNAAMLSRDVAETLGTVVDNSVNLSGNKLKDTDGNDINFTSWVGTNIRAIIVQLIGADKYVQLALQWQKANTIYHSAMAVVNTTQSMLDPISSAVEYGMENVSKIGNSLKEDGVVSENAYPAMNETIRARRVNRFERLNDTLEGAENIASNLSSVTSSAVSVKEDYQQLREDSKELRDKANAFNTADSEARAALKAELPTEITAITLAPAPAEDES